MNKYLNEDAKAAWNAYSKSVGGKAVNGDPLPSWEAMLVERPAVANAWADVVVEMKAKLKWDQERVVIYIDHPDVKPVAWLKMRASNRERWRNLIIEEYELLKNAQEQDGSELPI